ncbi:potassium channel family protein [Campylobacter geochelonis]|uniref:TrkA domain-containing protein n=1 Tax=Campylobacter geochelonis TaxID=1780362 RepID=A0A128EGR2_9BACT|nr:potassium channel protein [Campylobacter geochelonis]CZE47124.1 TrkA domain-containing protein [Campylobacter geochelonis]CZE47602.1 TrkA domain-containing protein [Campylobacter geochelonis]CZE50187.1 TrkA domain-containing protein [Campylobacter geochelonis]
MSLFDKVKKFLNWSRTPKPDFDLNTEIYEQFKPFRLPLILVVMLMVVGTVGYMTFSNFSLFDAFYQAGMTFTTVGFTEVAEITPAGRIFTIFFIFAGFGAFTFSLGIVVESLKKGILVNKIRERSMIYKIARLKNHFVICHHNIYTAELARQFRENHIPFVVIDSRADLHEIAEVNKYPYYVIGEPHMEISLLKSNLSSAKGIIALGSNIADNIAVIATVRLYEKELERHKPYFITTFTENDADAEKLKKLGADFVISPSKLTAQRLSAISVRPDMENILERFLYKKDSPIDIEEITVPEHSWVRFKRLKETHLRDMTSADIVGIRDENDKFIPMPNGDVLIGTGAKLLVVGTADGISFTKKLINGRYKPQEFKYV